MKMTSSSSQKKTPSRRGNNFHPLDDQQLAKAWISVSEDPIKGTDQTKTIFWTSVKEVGQFLARTPESLRQRWRVLSHAVSKFSGHMNSVTKLNQSGTNNEDTLSKALELFKKDEGREFKFLPCYDILSECPKFKSEPTTSATASPASSSPNVSALSSGSPKGRPIGRDRAKIAGSISSVEVRRVEALERIASATEKKAEVFADLSSALKHQNFLRVATTPIDDLDPISRKIILIEKKRVLQELYASDSQRNVESGRDNRAACSTPSPSSAVIEMPEKRDPDDDNDDDVDSASDMIVYDAVGDENDFHN